LRKKTIESKKLIKKMKRSFLDQPTSKEHGKSGRKGYSTTAKGATDGKLLLHGHSLSGKRNYGFDY
jgi:hypothetical protein